MNLSQQDLADIAMLGMCLIIILWFWGCLGGKK
jgi:hypothetical protein